MLDLLPIELIDIIADFMDSDTIIRIYTIFPLDVFINTFFKNKYKIHKYGTRVLYERYVQKRDFLISDVRNVIRENNYEGLKHMNHLQHSSITCKTSIIRHSWLNNIYYDPELTYQIQNDTTLWDSEKYYIYEFDEFQCLPNITKVQNIDKIEDIENYDEYYLIVSAIRDYNLDVVIKYMTKINIEYVQIAICVSASKILQYFITKYPEYVLVVMDNYNRYGLILDEITDIDRNIFDVITSMTNYTMRTGVIIDNFIDPYLRDEEPFEFSCKYLGDYPYIDDMEDDIAYIEYGIRLAKHAGFTNLVRKLSKHVS